MNTHQHIIDRGPYKGMVETISDNPHPAKTARCYMCGESLTAASSWLSLVGDHQDGVFCSRYLCRLCAYERLNGIPDDAERCWNYTQAARSTDRLARVIIHLVMESVVVAAGASVLFAFFILINNLLN